MKNRIRMVALLSGCVSFFLAKCEAEVFIINRGGASLPRQLATQGQSWTAASANWMLLLRQHGSVVGSGRDQALLETDLGDYRGMISTSAFRNWKGLTDSSGPTVEYGNQYFEGMKFVATGGDTFIPSSISVTVSSYAHDALGVYELLGSSTTNMNSLNYFRQRLDPGPDGIPGTPDDTVSSTQSTSIASTGFLYGGTGASIPAGTTGTDQQRLDAIANDRWARQYKLVYTVSIPYTPSGGGPTQTKVFSWERLRKQTKVGLSEDGKIVISDTVPGRSYTIEHSETLLPESWTILQVVSGNSGPIEIAMPHKGNPLFPKMFYRVRY